MNSLRQLAEALGWIVRAVFEQRLAAFDALTEELEPLRDLASALVEARRERAQKGK